jgi:RND family efflux transporter MFP subunit
MTTKKIILNIVASVLILAVGAGAIQYLLTSAPKAEKQKPTASGLLVDTTQISLAPYTLGITSVGTIEPALKTILSTKVSGKIIQTSSAFIPGGIVKKGDVLARIDSLDYEAALAQLKAQLSSALATEQIELGQQASARKELELSNLNPTGLNRSLMLREPQLAQVKATITNLEASLRMAQNNLNECTIKAPYDGVITKKSLELGSFITSQSTVAEIVSTESFWLNVTIPSAYLSFIDTLNPTELTKLPVSLFQKDKRLDVEATIIKLLPELDTATKQARLLIEVRDPLGLKAQTQVKRPKLLLGDTLHVSITAKIFETVLALPVKYLRANNTVWVMDSNNTLRIKPVVLHAKDERFALIAKGIDESDVIVTTYMTTAVEGASLVGMKGVKAAPKGE